MRQLPADVLRDGLRALRQASSSPSDQGFGAQSTTHRSYYITLSLQLALVIGCGSHDVNTYNDKMAEKMWNILPKYAYIFFITKLLLTALPEINLKKKSFIQEDIF